MGINIVILVNNFSGADILHEPHGSNIGGSSPSGPMKSISLFCCRISVSLVGTKLSVGDSVVAVPHVARPICLRCLFFLQKTK